MKPNEFYIGALDFFAILMPGAIVTAILSPFYSDLIFISLSTEASKWTAFLISAYFIGHLVYLLGSYIDRFYNVIRERISPYGNESAYQCATRIRDSLVDESEREALNTFQWSRSVLVSTCSAAAEDVHRLEADSKFFRSLMVVCAMAAAVFFVHSRSVEGAAALALVVPCFVRYYERRLKSTTQAYIHIITLHRLGRLVVIDKPHIL